MGCGCEPEGGLLVIDAVGWRSMYIVVMPAYLFITCTLKGLVLELCLSIAICDLFTQHVISLWRDTTSELRTPVLFSLLLNQSPPKLCLIFCNLLFCNNSPSTRYV